MRLSAAPLVGFSDWDLYVDRRVDADIRRVLADGDNVLLRSRRGAGATSLLRRLEADVEHAIYVNAAEAVSADQVVGAVSARAMPQARAGDVAALLPSFQVGDPLADPRWLSEFKRRLQAAEKDYVVLLDGPIEPLVSYDLFGRHRDAVFGLPLTWVVVAHDHRVGEYLEPPADVFFPEILDIGDLDTERASDLLLRREAEELAVPDVTRRLLDASDGTPRSLLTVARRFARTGQADDDMLARLAEAQAHLSRGAGMLLAELQGRGPTTATDRVLRERLGATDRDLRRRFAELEQAGLVRSVPAGAGGPGRPAATWTLTELAETPSQGTRIA